MDLRGGPATAVPIAIDGLRAFESVSTSVVGSFPRRWSAARALLGWWWRQSRAAVKRSATVGRRESPPDFCRLAGGGGDASNASHDCGLARELLGIGRKGNCECVGLCCRSFHEGTSWEERTRLAGRDLDADAALRRARHLFPEASSSRDCPPVECLVVR